MRKNKKGYLLLALMVLTGLAGTVSDNSLLYRERKGAIAEMNETESALRVAVTQLSAAQLQFKPTANAGSVAEQLAHIAYSEMLFWEQLRLELKQPVDLEKAKTASMDDPEIGVLVSQRSTELLLYSGMQRPLPREINGADWLHDFNAQRALRKRYIRTSTEDLRHHVLTTAIGRMDGYQFILFMNAHSKGHADSIQRLLADPLFPH